MADLDLTNFQGFLDYEGTGYLVEKIEEQTDAKIAVETERATNAETTLSNNLSSHTSNTSNPHGVTKSQVGLGNVDNTSDADKPISTATQNALNAKAPIASPTLTGTPKAPTATAGTNTTQIATTAFVTSAVTTAKNDLLNGAGTAYDTLKELGDLIDDNVDAIEALETVAASKASASDLTNHTGNTTVHITSAERTSWNGASTNSHTHSNKTVLDNTTASYTTAEKTKLSGIATGAEVNQNAFSNVVVGSTTIAADAKTDTLTLIAGSNITLTPDATNDKITIAATDTKYTHPTYTARTGKPTANQTPAFGGTATISQITSDATGHVTGATDRTITIPSTLSNGAGTAGLIKTTSTVTSNSGYTACPVISGVPYYKDTNTTYSVATQSANGLMHAADKKVFDSLVDGYLLRSYSIGAGSQPGYLKYTSKHWHATMPATESMEVKFADVDTEPVESSTNLITSGAVYDLKKSVADGKELLATTISGYGYSTVASDATFEEINTGIKTAVSRSFDAGYDDGMSDAFVQFYIPSLYIENVSDVNAFVRLHDILAVPESINQNLIEDCAGYWVTITAYSEDLDRWVFVNTLTGRFEDEPVSILEHWGAGTLATQDIYFAVDAASHMELSEIIITFLSKYSDNLLRNSSGGIEGIVDSNSSFSNTV